MEPSSTSHRRSAARAAWRSAAPWTALLLFATLIRGELLLTRYSELSADPDAYRVLAQNIARHGVLGRSAPMQPLDKVYPTAYRPPLYPLVLAPLAKSGELSLPGTAVLHLLLGLATVAGTVWLGDAYGLGPFRWLAGLLVACDPLLLNQSTLIMTETLAALLATVVLIAAERLRTRPSLVAAAATGAAAALAALCRPTFLPLVGVLAAIELTRGRAGATWANRLSRSAMVVVAAVVVIGPWAYRNERVFGRWIATTTHGGYTLLLGNNPDFYQFLDTSRWGDVWVPTDLYADCAMGKEANSKPPSYDPLMPTGMSEVDENRHLYACAWRNIRNQPSSAIRSSIYRVGQLWSPLAHSTGSSESVSRTTARWIAAAWNAAILVAALIGLVRIRRPSLRGPWIAGLALCLIFTLIHSLYWSNLRMRSPLVPFVTLLATSVFIPSHLVRK